MSPFNWLCKLVQAAPEQAPQGGEPAPDRAPARSVRTQSPLSAGWSAFGCSVVGTSHVAAGGGCEDWSKIVGFEGGMLLAVADGAGSVPRARRGAELAVSAAAEAAVARLLGAVAPADDGEWDALLVDCLRSARRALEADEGELRELSCTLLLAILYQDTLAVAQVGDGWIVAQDRDGSLRAVTVPDKGEYFNETTFVTSDAYLERSARCVGSVAEVIGLAVLSDGLEMVAFDLRAREPYAGFFLPLFKFAREPSLPRAVKVEELRCLLGSDRVNRRTYDDKTLLLAVRLGEPEAEAPTSEPVEPS